MYINHNIVIYWVFNAILYANIFLKKLSYINRSFGYFLCMNSRLSVVHYQGSCLKSSHEYIQI